MARIPELLNVAAGSWYSIRNGHFCVTKQVRPRWTLVVAVLLFPLGLPFLLMRRAQAAEVTIVDGPRGAVVTVTGDLAPRLVGVLDEGLRARSWADAPQVSADERLPRTVSISHEAREPVPERAAPRAPGGAQPVDVTSVRGHGRPEAASFDVQRKLLLPGGRSIELPREGRILLGRDPQGGTDVVPVQIDDPGMSVSKTHAALTVAESGATVEDLHSTNGTGLTVDGYPVDHLHPGAPRPVQTGAGIILGDVRVEYVEQKGRFSR